MGRGREEEREGTKVSRFGMQPYSRAVLWELPVLLRWWFYMIVGAYPMMGGFWSYSVRLSYRICSVKPQKGLYLRCMCIHLR